MRSSDSPMFTKFYCLDLVVLSSARIHVRGGAGSHASGWTFECILAPSLRTCRAVYKDSESCSFLSDLIVQLATARANRKMTTATLSIILVLVCAFPRARGIQTLGLYKGGGVNNSASVQSDHIVKSEFSKFQR